jgi:alkylation response protein AidB-like acyl-CoA dehydrogenase
MSMSRAELQDAASRAFGDANLAPDAEQSWQLIADMGWLMMTVPEPLGGLGLGAEAAGVIHSELGRALVPGPVIAQMLVIEALAAADQLVERDDLIARAMGGEVMTASLGGSGAFACIPDADRATHLLAIDANRIALVPLEGAKMTPRETWDKTRRLFDVVLARDAVRFAIAEGDAAAALASRLDTQRHFALAGDSLGGTAAILALTIDYLKTRRQFDRPLALFQALKHRVADLKTEHAAAEALFWSRATGNAHAIDMAALKALATTTYRTVTEEAVQLHGGIGLTMEHHCHLFLKRALLNCALGGDADHWEETAGRHVLATA